MPDTQKTKSNSKRVKKKEEKINMGKLQTTVCRDILDTAEVTKSQVASEVIEKFSSHVERESLKTSIKQINELIDRQADSLINRVLENLK